LKTLPPVGTHVVLQWVDSAEAPGWTYLTDEPKLYPRMITSRGIIVGRTPLGVVLGAHISEPSTEDGERGYLSLLAIPNGCVLKCEVLKS
jgi:hypothetical protein